MEKDDNINVRVPKKERQEYLKEATKKGYRNLSDFVLSTLRRFYKSTPCKKF